ncbi:5-formyltetrahydrofolate cyclo-ligase [Burkholderia aenigmatica]|uniref:5-formyltetrahydrofolate cyclo-ligase n=1 Tax=Burkholderia TaxID=32008 RepID=UPI000F0912BB|nr:MULTISPECIES: 5-formyltetrahydrofolate cyclo-ligase [Burkholderia]AYQ38499.1 5-formyltetrahydrofolate cyclo-ligase [Burkholderia lata]UKD09956.1 5-formyltetrahydrofolate cyclo-ligase [Burkholderia aenigmatica]VWC46965.1 5-formyltetrahydrofolate cyclo-ligase [Burkholderia aenigmatica]VWC76894.1 5-formyltetrahydrofolate cyclo-ligase [Burkholderia aenigmatica]
MKRRTFLALPAAAASGMLAGCADFGPVTKAWMKDSTYDETLSTFLITADGKQLVVLGQKYHYIFEMPPGLATVLTAPYRPKIHTAFNGFETHGDTITGRYAMRLDYSDAPTGSDVRERALADGFKQESGYLASKGTISGKRYLPNDVTPSSVPQAFNRPYHVTVTDKLTAVGHGAKLALSPIAMAADGALGLLGLALFPIALTTFIIVAS